MAIWIPVGEGARLRRLPLAGRDTDARGGLDEATSRRSPRLEPLVAAAEHVVPGHGGADRLGAALAVLDEDRAYLEALRARVRGAPAPAAERRDAEQRRLHAANVARL